MCHQHMIIHVFEQDLEKHKIIIYLWFCWWLIMLNADAYIEYTWYLGILKKTKKTKSICKDTPNYTEAV